MSPGTRARVGRYEIFDELAAGGMATVHLGRMNGAAGFSKSVAIKRLLSLRQDTEFVSSLLEEARLTERIRHPNVVATLDVVSSEQELLLVMEYVHGETLANLLRACATSGKRCSPEIAATIMRDVLLGLQAAHETTDALGQPLTIVHRDVSPQNVMIGSDGVARLLDFGIAKAMGSATTTREGQVKGKVPYMAPEILRFQPATTQSDVYAVGVVLWETLCARRLFRGDSEVDLWGKVLNQKVSKPSEVTAGVEVLDDVVMRALERDTSKRYPSALAMAKDIEQAVRLASPTEVAEWVASLAGSALAKRAAILRAAEALPMASEPPPNAPDVVVAAPAFAIDTGGSSAVSRAGEVPATSSSVRNTPGGSTRPRRGVGVAVAVLATIVVAALGFGGWRLRSARTTTTPVVSAPTTVATASSSPASPSASSSAMAVADPPVPAATDSTSPSSTPSSKKVRGGPRGTTTGTATSTATGRTKPAADPCDPPYSIGADGKKHFKLECVEQN